MAHNLAGIEASLAEAHDSGAIFRRARDQEFITPGPDSLCDTVSKSLDKRGNFSDFYLK